MDEYPNFCLRGLRAPDHRTEDGEISASAYYPDPDTVQNRQDGRCETSIDWEDEDEVLPNLLQRFRYGVARLPRKHIDEVNQYAQVKGGLSYERFPIVDNPHHGNILFPASIAQKSESKRRLIWATLLAANAILHLDTDQ